MRVIGIDPGLRRTGWGVVDVEGARIRHVANGVCVSVGVALAVRLESLHAALTAVLVAHRPDTAAVEQTFVNKDAAGTLKLGQARGIALLVPAQAGLEVAEYAPNAVKKVVVGVGHADKAQVAHMVRLQLPGVVLAGPDAADALAIALCHAHHARFRGRLDGGARGGRRVIGKVSGRLDYRGSDHVLIDTGGVGYLVYCSERTLAAMPAPGGAVALYTDLARARGPDAAHRLPDAGGARVAPAADTVQGVGAKAALAILGTLGPEGVARALSLGDVSAIRAAPGVGPKLAQRVVLELRAKAPAVMAMGAAGAAPAMVSGRPETLPELAPAAAPPAPMASPRPGRDAQARADALSALVNLGYGEGEAAAAVAGRRGRATPPDLIRAALRALAPKG